MALFVLTGVLSLGAGIGIGALLPDHSERQVVLKPKSTKPQAVLKTQHRAPQRKLEGGASPVQTLNFNDFDKSLMKMLQTQPAAKVSTMRRSVAKDPRFYSPPSKMPTPLQAPLPTPLQAPLSTPLQAPLPTPLQAPLSTPLQASQLEGGGRTQPQNALNTSWF